MNDTPQETREVPHTREVSGEIAHRSGGTFGAIADAVQMVGGPTAIATGAGIVAKQAKDIIVAKIQANAQIEVAKIENSHRPEGGVHPADD